MSALRGFYNYLRLNQKRLDLDKVYAYDIMRGIKNERIKPSITKPILTLNQAKHLILHTKKIRKYIWHYRDHAIIYLMLTTGLRGHDIVHVKRRNLKKRKGEYLLYIDEKSFVKVPPGAFKALTEYLDKRKDDNPYMFIAHKNTSKKGI